MKFGLYPLSECQGAILAHSLHIHSKKIPKGTILREEQLASIKTTKLTELMVAILEHDDIGEDEAAKIIGNRLVELEPAFVASAPFTGRVNLFATKPGLIEINPDKIKQFNLVDQSITLATLGHHVRVSKNQLVCTIKVIQYGVKSALVNTALDQLDDTIRFRAVTLTSADLIMTVQTLRDEKLAAKGLQATRLRLESLGIELNTTVTTEHNTTELTKAIKSCVSPIILILTSSATSDKNDIGPKALCSAGGTLVQVGIPVDPGNLLFYGQLGIQEVIGLPGCVRSIALNGADWVLERIACGIKLTTEDFASMGAGGLLKEIPTRRQPRNSLRTRPTKPKVFALVLSENKVSDDTKLLSPLIKSQIEGIYVVGDSSISFEGLETWSNRIRTVVHPLDSSKSNQIRLGLEALPNDTEAVIFVRGSQQPIATLDIDRLISGFSPTDGREIGTIMKSHSSPSPPLLFGRRFFENLSTLALGQKPVDLISEARDFVYEIQSG